MKTNELIGPALDWAVSKCEFGDADEWSDDADFDLDTVTDMEYYGGSFNPSKYWAQGGPIIERELIDVLTCDGGDYWQAHIYASDERIEQYGPTPLIAAMRCYVASKLGDNVDVPEELHSAMLQ